MVTTYTVDPHTSRNTMVTDRCGNRTCYEYDENGRTTKVTGKDSEGNQQANVSYGYDAFDNLTGIVRDDGLKYVLGYNAFHKLESIGVEGKEESLVSYTYKGGNGRLKAVTYANGDTMKAYYNSLGHMTAEKWYNADEELIAHYQYAYDNQGNIVRSVDILGLKEYIYSYESGRIIHSREYAVTLDENSIITARTPVSTIRYYYDTEGVLTKKQIIFADGTERTVHYENSENENTIVRFDANGQTVTSHSKTDSFGRKVFEEVQLGTGFVSRQFAYHAGAVTQAHEDNDKLKSSATTNLVSQIILSDGRTLSYTYDAEERITSVVEAVQGSADPIKTTTYTYDAQGQLLTETVNGDLVNTMTYDGYGNILTKNGKTYTYGDSVWKDKLTAYDGYSFTYDAQGNTTVYKGMTLKWEKGRQLKIFGTNSYTYNANGIRTGKTVNGVTHAYTLDGTNILKETWDNNTLIPIYDNEEQICGIAYNGTSYFFLKNLQGDIIAITDKNGDVVARYSYDAWGKCTITEDETDFGLATINPYRYRGYYYDTETGLYYLQSRYYDPEIGRFINSDNPEWAVSESKIIETNIFCYCKNDPVDHVDDLGFGGIDGLLSALGNCVDVIIKVIDMIGNSYNKQKKQLTSSIKLLTKKQGRTLSNIKSLQKSVNSVTRVLGWIGYGITFVTLAAIFAASYINGRDLNNTIIDVAIESFVSLIEYGAGKIFEKIAKFIPYVGFLLGLIAGWAVTYLLQKYFNNSRVTRIKTKFRSFVKNIKVTLWNWVKYAVKSLTA